MAKGIYNPSKNKNNIKKVRKLVQQYNAKITRASKKNPWLEDILPNRIKTADLLKNYKNYKEFQDNFKSKERFLKKGVELPVSNKYGVVISRYEFNEIKYKNIRRNNLKKKEKAKLDKMNRITKLGLTPNQFNFQNMRPSDFKKFTKVLENRLSPDYDYKRAETYRDNLMKSVDTLYGTTNDPDTQEIIAKVAQKLSTMTAEQLVELNNNSQEENFEIWYHEHVTDLYERAQNLLNYLNQI